MDKITQNLLTEFLTERGLQDLPEDQAFEHFAGHLIVSDHYTESFDTDEIIVGHGGDTGLDCIGIIVNGSLVTEPEEIDDLVETNGYVDAVFVFVQAERSSSFSTDKVGQIGFGVKDFFSDQPRLQRNAKITEKANIAEAVYKRSGKFTKGNPQCYVYYVTTGKWQDDQNLAGRREALIEEVKQLSLFRRVDFQFVDAQRLQTLYRESKNSNTAEINFSFRTALPDLPEVQQSYLGLLPVNEYLKFVQNDNQEMITSVFYDNVRHWQGWNDVNSSIKKTLENPAKRVYFPLLNNGITIVARTVNPTGNKMTVEDYQIVNGCQTSFVLHETQATLDPQMLVPVRIIATRDSDIRNSIIQATNRQTEVTNEQLFALSEFPRKLEEYFPTFEDPNKLYYERRSRQYASVPDIEKVRIVTMAVLVRSYASMFLQQPHRTTRNYKALLRSIGNEIFSPAHVLEMYYSAAYTHYRLDFLFRNQILDPKFKPAKYHLLMAFRLLANPTPLPLPNSREMQRYCKILMDIAWDDARSRKIFEQAAKLVSTVARDNLDRDNVRTEPFTKRLMLKLQPAKRKTKVASKKRKTGKK